MLINYLFGLISINYLFGFNIKDNGIRCHNFDIVPCFELSILLLLWLSKIEKVILLLKFETWSVFLISWSLFIFAIYISFECVCIYKYWEFCFINLRIVNYFVGFSNYTPAMRCWQHKHICMVLTFYKNLSYNLSYNTSKL